MLANSYPLSTQENNDDPARVRYDSRIGPLHDAHMGLFKPITWINLYITITTPVLYQPVMITRALQPCYAYDARTRIFHQLVEQHFLQACYTIIVKACTEEDNGRKRR